MAAVIFLALLAGAAYWLWAPDTPRAELEAKYLAPDCGYRAVAGLNVYLCDSGPRAAPAVILLHGFGSSLQTWDAWAKLLETDHRVIRFDLPGSGLTGADPTGDYRDSRSIAVLSDLMRALGVDRASLVGNSIGGRIAWKFAAEQPGRVDRLVLISPDGFASLGFEYGKPSQVPAILNLMRAAFTKAHPGIDVKLTIGNREEIIKALADFTIDIAIIGRPPVELELSRALIGDHPHLIIASPGHRLKNAATIALADLRDEVFLNREPGSGTRALMERIFAEAGITPRFGMEIASNETIKQAVMAGLGMAFLSAHTVASEIADGRLISLPVQGLPVVRHWFVVHQAKKTLLPPSQALWDFMTHQGARFLPSVAPPTGV